MRTTVLSPPMEAAFGVLLVRLICCPFHLSLWIYSLRGRGDQLALAGWRDASPESSSPCPPHTHSDLLHAPQQACDDEHVP